MNTSMIGRWVGAGLLAGAMSLTGVLPSYAAEADTSAMATPARAVPGMQLIFHAAGFQGADSGNGEQVSYWINTPDGGIISTEPLSKADKNGNTTEPMRAYAGSDGAATIYWTAPANLAPGGYSLVVHGLDSGHQVVIPFRLLPQGSQTVTQYNVMPSAGPGGTQFVFHAAGFQGADSGNGEQVSYWINTPDGGIISTEPLSKADKYGNTTRPLTGYAGSDGVAKIFWTAPANLAPGGYSLVVHGLNSQAQVRIPFSIQ